MGSADGSEQINTTIDSLSKTLSREKTLAFVKVDNDSNTDVSIEYNITEFPTFLIFESGKLAEKLQGDDLEGLQTRATKLSDGGQLSEEMEGLQTRAKKLSDVRKMQKPLEHVAKNKDSPHVVGGTTASAPGETWRGAELPRGYNDITDQVDIRDCEVLNADDEAGTVRVLFEPSKPSALNNGKGTSKDWVQSGSDDQLLLYVPFQSIAKLHTLQVMNSCSCLSRDCTNTQSRLHPYHLQKTKAKSQDRASSISSSTDHTIWTLPRLTSLTLRKLLPWVLMTGILKELQTSTCDSSSSRKPRHSLCMSNRETAKQMLFVWTEYD